MAYALGVQVPLVAPKILQKRMFCDYGETGRHADSGCCGIRLGGASPDSSHQKFYKNECFATMVKLADTQTPDAVAYALGVHRPDSSHQTLLFILCYLLSVI